MERVLRVFLADDDIDDVELFESTIHAIDPAIQFDSAADGLEAIQFLEHAPYPDIIFLDLNMPMADGRICLQTIKNNERLRNIPVIIFTTSSIASDVKDCLGLGAICYITKPTDLVEWRTILRTIINHIDEDIVGELKKLRTEVGIHCQH